MGQLPALAKVTSAPALHPQQHAAAQPPGLVHAQQEPVTALEISLMLAAQDRCKWQCLHHHMWGGQGLEAWPTIYWGGILESLPLLQVLAELSPFQRERAAAQMLQAGYVRSLLDIFQARSSRHLHKHLPACSVRTGERCVRPSGWPVACHMASQAKRRAVHCVAGLWQCHRAPAEAGLVAGDVLAAKTAFTGGVICLLRAAM